MTKLTSRTSFTSANRTKNIVLHCVDTLDLSQDPAGSSYKARIEQIQGFKEYIALISQSGASAPTVTVIKNELGGTITWGYTSTGIYTGTLTGAWTAGKTAIFIGQSDIQSWASAVRTDANVITIKTYITTGANNSKLAEASLRILVGI